MNAIAALLPHGPASRFVAQSIEDSMGQSCWLPGRNKVPVHSILDDFRRATDGGSHHGDSGRERLQDDSGQPLRVGGQDQEVEVGQEPVEVGAEPRHDELLLQSVRGNAAFEIRTQGTAAEEDEPQRRVGPRDQSSRIHEVRESLFRA